MKISVLHDKILVVDDLYDAAEYARIEQEIAALRPRIEPTYHETDVVLYRASLDSIYTDRKQSFILQAVPTKLYSDEVLKAAEGILDLSFTFLNKQHKYTTVLTEMRGDTNYRSHTDTGDGINWTQIFMSWIWYYNPRPELFTGGELVAEDFDAFIEPRDNRLVLLPAYLNHRINPSVYTEDGYYRTTVNGFLTWSPAGESQGANLEQEIERSLASDSAGVMAHMVLPRPAGELDLVRATAAKTIARMEQAGMAVGNAATHLRRGDSCFQGGQYRDAFGHYRKAYRRAVGVEPG